MHLSKLTKLNNNDFSMGKIKKINFQSEKKISQKYFQLSREKKLIF